MTSILVVDDNPIDRRLVGGLLSCIEGWQLEFANDGAAALQLMENGFVPDIIVTDIQMPQVNGLELVATVKKQYPRLPVLLITSQGSDEIALQALKAGAVNYSPKSCLSRDLVRTIQKVISIAEKVSSTAVVTIAPTDTFHCKIEIDNDSDMIWPLIEQLQHNMPPWIDQDRLQVGMALDEAISNAIYHGNLEVDSCLKEENNDEFYTLVDKRRQVEPYAQRRVRVETEFSPKVVTFSIADQGPGFDPDTVADPREKENLSKLSGRGLLLIRSFMDDVWHNNAGNRITMVKRQPGTQAAGQQSVDERVAGEQAAGETAG
jgi:CheY-like chemotaxis protein/anti-sigma regulatory factor (Ser/Thr protein kinase)